MKHKFSVVTPAYNRGYIIGQLYESLCNQLYTDFEWLIIDDGSTDNTEKLIQDFQKQEHPFEIRYVFQKNSGKPSALNKALDLAQGKYFFIVDSDDKLTPDAMTLMDKWTEEIDADGKFVGVGACRGYSETEYMKGVEPTVNSNGYVDATNLERKKYNLDADMCEAYKTEILKKYPFYVVPGEKFAPEQISINKMALDGYFVRWHSKIIYLCKYLEDGLTKNSFTLEKKNPLGYAEMYNQALRYPGNSIKQKLFLSCQFTALALYGKKKSYLKNSNNKVCTFITYPAGYFLSKRREKQFSQS